MFTPNCILIPRLSVSFLCPIFGVNPSQSDGNYTYILLFIIHTLSLQKIE